MFGKGLSRDKEYHSPVSLISVPMKIVEKIKELKRIKIKKLKLLMNLTENKHSFHNINHLDFGEGKKRQAEKVNILYLMFYERLQQRLLSKFNDQEVGG